MTLVRRDGSVLPGDGAPLISRRTLLAGTAALAAAPAFAQLPPGPPKLGPNRLVLLGTKGGPAIRGYSPSPSASVLVWNDVPYVIDAGYGVTFKLTDARIPLVALRHVFVTHHHSDHNLELGALCYNAWAIGLKAPVDVYAPEGVEAVLDGFMASQRADIETRMADEGRPDLRTLVRPHVVREGVVFERDGLKVSALRNLHPPVVESYAYKFEMPGRTVVFSGDTAYFPPLADFARGADILVHEVAYEPGLEALAARNPNGPTLLAHLKASHTMTEDVGRIAAAAGVKTLVLNHFVPADDRSLTPEVWTDSVRKTFAGTIVVGRDLLEIPLG